MAEWTPEQIDQMEGNVARMNELLFKNVRNGDWNKAAITAALLGTAVELIQRGAVIKGRK